MRCFSVASMSIPLQWPVIFTRDHKRLLFGLDIHISATAGTQEPKCLKLSAGREEEGDEVGHPVQSLAGKTYRHRSALRPRHVGIQNVDTKDYPANQTRSFAPFSIYEAVWCFFPRNLVSPPISSFITRHPDRSPAADASCHLRHLLALCGAAHRALPFRSISAETGCAPRWEMHLLLPWVALTRDFLGLFWCREVCFVARKGVGEEDFFTS